MAKFIVSVPSVRTIIEARNAKQAEDKGYDWLNDCKDQDEYFGELHITKVEKKEGKQARNIVDMADVCELAHKLTVNECAEKKIEVNCKDAEDCGDDGQDHTGEDGEDGTHYTEEAQDIFNYFYDEITSTLSV